MIIKIYEFDEELFQKLFLVSFLITYGTYLSKNLNNKLLTN